MNKNTFAQEILRTRPQKAHLDFNSCKSSLGPRHSFGLVCKLLDMNPLLSQKYLSNKIRSIEQSEALAVSCTKGSVKKAIHAHVKVASRWRLGSRYFTYQAPTTKDERKESLGPG